MVSFEKINSLLDKFEYLVDNDEFEITNPNCSHLFAEIEGEINYLAPHCDPTLWGDGMSWSGPFEPGKEERKFRNVQRRFNRCCKSIETPSQFFEGIRNMMFPDGEDDDFDVDDFYGED